MDRYIVLFFGVVGLFVPLWVARSYTAADDGLALGIIAFIVAGFCFGVWELWRRASELHRLEHELAKFNWSSVDESRLRELSPTLHWVIQARLYAGTGGALLGNLFSGYLVTALILLGLIGTFLGLVDTLGGTRTALETTDNIDALRSSLLSPIAGLARAYGTAVSGVAASAILGLAAVFVRRHESRFSRQVAGLVVGPLGHLHPLKRQAVALERLVAQNEELPQVTNNFREAVASLNNLQNEIREGQRQLGEQVATAILERASLIRRDLSTGIQQLVAATGPAIQQLVDHAIRAVDEKGQALFERNNRLLVSRVQHDKEFHATLQKLLESEHKTRSEQDQRYIEQMTAHMEQLYGRLQAYIDAIGERHGSYLKKLEEKYAESEQHWREQARTRQREDESRWKTINADWDKLREQKYAQVDLLDRRQQDHLAKLTEEFHGFVERLGKEWERRREGLEDDLQRRQKHFGELSNTLETTASKLGELVHKADSVMDRQGHSLMKWERELDDSRQGHLLALSKTLEGHAETLVEKLSICTRAVEDAADLVRVGGAEMAGVASMFATAVEQYQSASDRWMDNLAYLEKNLIGQHDGGDHLERMGAYLDKTREAFEESLKVQHELASELRSQRGVRPS